MMVVPPHHPKIPTLPLPGTERWAQKPQWKERLLPWPCPRGARTRARAGCGCARACFLFSVLFVKAAAGRGGTTTVEAADLLRALGRGY